MKVYTEVSITHHHAGFGMYQRGELQVNPQTSFAVLSDLEFEGQLTSLDDALVDDEFKSAGVKDIRGLIYNQPSRIYCKLSDTPEGPAVDYYGVEETEVADDFYK